MTRQDLIKKWLYARPYPVDYSAVEIHAACVMAAGMEWAAMRQVQLATCGAVTESTAKLMGEDWI